jgi:hypothetical protein
MVLGTERFMDLVKLDLVKFIDGGLFLGSRKCLLPTWLPQKIIITSKVAESY